MSIKGIDQFKSSFKGGARPNLYRVHIGKSDLIDEATGILVKAASIPASTVGVIAVPFRGRQFKVAGDRVFEPWEITVFNDADWKVRTAFEKWLDQVNNHRSNVSDAGFEDNNYLHDCQVVQEKRENGGDIKKYEFVGCWPSNIGPIELGWESNDAVEEFSVTLEYQYWHNTNTK